jgi:hypothetical protein
MNTSVHRLTPVDTDASPLIFGAIRSPREHAAKLVEYVLAGGPEIYGRAIHQGHLEDWHLEMCEKLEWALRKWPSVGRELAKLPGVRKGKVRLNGERLTVYEFSPAATERRRSGGAQAGEHKEIARPTGVPIGRGLGLFLDERHYGGARLFHGRLPRAAPLFLPAAVLGRRQADRRLALTPSCSAQLVEAAWRVRGRPIF